MRWGWNFLKRGPPTPDPELLLLCQRRGSPRSLACSSLRAALKRSSKFFATTFLSPLHQMTPGSVIVASVGSGPQLPHTNVATHPEVLPPHNREVSGCHLSSFL